MCLLPPSPSPLSALPTTSKGDEDSGHTGTLRRCKCPHARRWATLNLCSNRRWTRWNGLVAGASALEGACGIGQPRSPLASSLCARPYATRRHRVKGARPAASLPAARGSIRCVDNQRPTSCMQLRTCALHVLCGRARSVWLPDWYTLMMWHWHCAPANCSMPGKLPLEEHCPGPVH